jgi:2-oxo-hept-3-ene-1,7-dioate hydratase
VSITEPDYGALFDDMFFDDGGTIPSGRFIRPRIEVELAFILDRPLNGPGVTIYDVLDATRYVTPALEILDARVQMSDPETGHLRTIVDTVADNAADAGIVLGGRAVRLAVRQWRHRGVRSCCGSAESSSKRGRLARQQAGSLWSRT